MRMTGSGSCLGRRFRAGLIDLGARLYDPGLGQYLSPDPLVGGDPYVYVRDNPLSRIDPLGLSSCFTGAKPTEADGSGGVTCLQKIVVTGSMSELLAQDLAMWNAIQALDSALQVPASSWGFNVPPVCVSALKTAGQTRAAVARAKAAWATIRAAAQAHNIDSALLAAIGIRETGFQNVWQSGNGWGAGVFQIDLSEHPNVTVAQVFNVSWAANSAAGMLAGNESTLSAEFPNLTAAQLLQATATSYNLGVGGISGNPSTIDVGTPGGDYGSNVVGLMQCFK